MSLSTDLPLIRPTRVRYLVVAVLCLISAVAYVQRNSYGGAEKKIRDELHLTPGQTGGAAGLLFLPYALLQVPAGWLAQRTGPRRTIVFCAAGWSITLGLCALAADPYSLIGGRLMVGTLQAGLLPSATLIVAAWLPASRRGAASGLLQSAMLIGGALNYNLTGALIEQLGWRGLFLLYAGPGLVWALLFAVWFRNRPADHPGVNAAELDIIQQGQTGAQPSAERRPVPWVILLSLPLYCVCIQQFFRAGASRFVDTWLVTYLQEGPYLHDGQPLQLGVNIFGMLGSPLGQGPLLAVCGLSPQQMGAAAANQLGSLPQWLGVVGSTLGGLLSDYLLKRTGSRRVARQGLAIASIIGALALYVLAYTLSNVTLAMIAFSAGFFVFYFSASCAFAVTLDMGGRNLGVVFGLMNMTGNFGSAAFATLAPVLNDWFHMGWTPTLILFAVMHVAALLFWLPLNPNGVIGERLPAPAIKE